MSEADIALRGVPPQVGGREEQVMDAHRVAIAQSFRHDRPRRDEAQRRRAQYGLPNANASSKACQKSGGRSRSRMRFRRNSRTYCARAVMIDGSLQSFGGRRTIHALIEAAEGDSSGRLDRLAGHAVTLMTAGLPLAADALSQGGELSRSATRRRHLLGKMARSDPRCPRWVRTSRPFYRRPENGRGHQPLSLSRHFSAG